MNNPQSAIPVPVRKDPQSTQRTLSLDLRNGRPLCSLSAAMAVLGVRADIVKEMWERGDLQFAFDIASHDATKIEPRIAIASIAAYQAGYRGRVSHHPDDTELDLLLDGLWPHTKPHLRLSEVYDALCCSSQHALDLWKWGEFSTANIARESTTKVRLSPIMHRASVISFLKSRRLT